MKKRTSIQPFVSIIVLTCNRKYFLEDCFNSLKKLNYPEGKYEVIMVDNGSTDGTIEYVKKRFKWIKIITLDKNYGFAEGNNRGIRFAKGKYIVFLNDDVKVDKNWLKELVNIALRSKKIGICGSLIKDYYNPHLIQSAENYLDFFGSIIHKGWFEKDKGQFKKPTPVFYVGGGSLLITREVLSRLRYCFDPDFFQYFEDTDLCWRVKLLGYEVFLVPTSIVYHKGSIDPNKVKPINIWRCTRNKILSFRKNLRAPIKQLLLLLLLFRTFITVTYWKYKGKWRFGLSFLSALVSPVNYDLNLKKIPLKKQLSVFSFPRIKKYFDFLKVSSMVAKFPDFNHITLNRQ